METGSSLDRNYDIPLECIEKDKNFFVKAYSRPILCIFGEAKRMVNNR